MTPSIQGLEILREHAPKPCTCREKEGDDNACPEHGICYEDRRQDDVEREAEERDFYRTQNDNRTAGYPI